MNVAVFGRKVTKQNLEYYNRFLGILKDYGWNPVVESNLKKLLVKKAGISESTDEFHSHKDFKSGIDLSFSIGGDGTFIENVKFHIDTVKDLGAFMEIEAIDHDDNIGKEKLLEQCNSYLKLFGILEEDLISVSYSDLLLEKVD